MCRTQGFCQPTGWLVTTPPDFSCNGGPLPAECPNAPMDGAICSNNYVECWYESGTACTCSPCLNGNEYPVCAPIDPPQWSCWTPPQGCPSRIPDAGAPCDVEVSCGPSCELGVECFEGRWHWRYGECPVCASPDTPIATPDGDRPIASLQPGDWVYSIDDGATVAVRIARIGSTLVHDHHVLRVELNDGSAFEMSPGHPTADGRPLGTLRPGSRLDESHIVRRIELIPYLHARTYDILPESESGAYFADGVLVGSTLARDGTALPMMGR